uniref:Conserved oligomeric Golgi complex subunit 7 n=1 Tax=Timema douglasi TaxID=61478 RepID=A0A7R8VKL5_TIMDO|nr:unnamed protein product [Timema douglasi]
MDIAAFSDDNFEAKAWINKTFKSAEAQENKDAFVSSLVMKLQLYVQQVNSALEDTSQQVLQSLPRVMRDTELLHQEALLLREKMQLVKVEIAKVEQDTGQSMATLERIDNIKTELQAAKQALHEADNWIILAADLEEVFESGDIESISAKLVSMQQSLLILANVPDYEDRKLQLEGLKNRLEAMASPLLVQAFTSGSIAADDNTGCLSVVLTKSLFQNGESQHKGTRLPQTCFSTACDRETRNEFTPDLLQCVFDPWTSGKKEQLLSSVRNRLTAATSSDDDGQVNLADQPRSGRPATTSTPPNDQAAASLETKFVGGLRSGRLEQATSSTVRLIAHCAGMSRTKCKKQSRVFVRIFTSIDRLAQLLKYFHKCQKGGLIQQWRSILEADQDESVTDWLRKFYDALLSNWHEQTSSSIGVQSDRQPSDRHERTNLLKDQLLDTQKRQGPSDRHELDHLIDKLPYKRTNPPPPLSLDSSFHPILFSQPSSPSLTISTDRSSTLLPDFYLLLPLALICTTSSPHPVLLPPLSHMTFCIHPEQEVKWCGQVFSSVSSVGTLLELYADVLASLDPSVNMCVDASLKQQADQLSFLMDLKQITKHFATNLHAAIEATTQGKSWETLSALECNKEDLMDTVQGLGQSIPRAMLILNKANKRCLQFTEGCGYVGLLKAIKVFLSSYLDQYCLALRQLDKQKKVQEDWSMFQMCLTLLQNVGELLNQLKQLDRDLSMSVIDVSRKMEGQKDRNPFTCYNNLLLNSSGQKEFNSLVSSIQEEFIALPLKKLCSDVHHTTFQVIFAPISSQLDLVQSAPAWSATSKQAVTVTPDLPDFSYVPQEYITQIGQYLMTLPQHLEPFLLQDNPSLTLALQVADAEYGSLSRDTEGGLADVLLGIIARGTCQTYCETIMGICELTPTAGKQLATDIDYLGNVLEDLGLSLSEHLQQVTTLLRLSSEEYQIKSSGCSPRLVAAVRQMRNITSS